MLNQNMKDEIALIKQQVDIDKLNKSPTPDVQEKQVQSLSEKSSLVISGIDVVNDLLGQIDSTSGSTNPGEYKPPFKDADLVDVHDSMLKSMKDIKMLVQTYSQEEKLKNDAEKKKLDELERKTGLEMETSP